MTQRGKFKAGLAAFTLGGLLLSFQNCANNYALDLNSPNTSPQIASGNLAPPVTTDPTPVPTPLPPSQVVCNPFGSSSSGSAGHGLAADGIKYLTPAQTSANISSFADLWKNSLGLAAVNLILDEINVPNVYFSQGFTTDAGTVLKSTDGSTLSAYFGFTATGFLVLGDWTPGDYQIAVLSDDGSILTVTGGTLNPDGTTSDFVVNNDGTHSMKMGCSNAVVHLDANSRLPLSFSYYQGPPTTIGLMIIARPMPTGNVQDAQCGLGANNDGYFFNDRNYPAASIAQQPYLDLVSRGWTPIDATHYMLPDSVATTTNCSMSGH